MYRKAIHSQDFSKRETIIICFLAYCSKPYPIKIHPEMITLYHTNMHRVYTLLQNPINISASIKNTGRNKLWLIESRSADIRSPGRYSRYHRRSGWDHQYYGPPVFPRWNSHELDGENVVLHHPGIWAMRALAHTAFANGTVKVIVVYLQCNRRHTICCPRSNELTKDFRNCLVLQ